MKALRRPSAFRYHDDPTEWLRRTAHQHLETSSAMHHRAGDAGAEPPLTPFPLLLERARRRNQWRTVATLAVAIGLLVVIVVWFVASGVALDVVEPTLRQALGQAVSRAQGSGPSGP